MKVFLLLALMAVCFCSLGQKSDPVSIGKTHTFYSSILKEERTIWVYNPGPDKSHAGSGERYPVLYLLDAEEHFHATAGIIKQMTGRWPGMIVVGITNTNRRRDLTPPSTAAKDSNSGGADNFLQFIESELIPRVDSMYYTAPYRIFSGHSLGGLAVVHTLVNRPTLFNAYVAIDPSLWWDGQKLVGDAQRILPHIKFSNTSLFVGRAKNMPPKMDSVAALNDNTQYTMLFRAVTAFVNDLRTTSPEGLRWKTAFYPDETHGTVQLNAQYDALKFMFGYYQFRTSMLELNPQLNIDSLLTAHFKTVSKNLGYTVIPSETLVNNLGYTCMSMGKMEKAETFFKMNITNYPKSPNCYDSMGEFYEALGDTRKAIENYTHALTLGNDSDTRRKLDVLKNKK